MPSESFLLIFGSLFDLCLSPSGHIPRGTWLGSGSGPSRPEHWSLVGIPPSAAPTAQHLGPLGRTPCPRQSVAPRPPVASPCPTFPALLPTSPAPFIMPTLSAFHPPLICSRFQLIILNGHQFSRASGNNGDLGLN